MRRCLLFVHLLLLLIVFAGPAWAGGGDTVDLAEQIKSWAAPTAIGVFLILLIVLSKTAWKQCGHVHLLCCEQV